MDTRFVAAVAACAVVLGAGAANAADLPVRMTTKAPVYTKAPPPIELDTWTGFYVGANVGFASARAESDIMATVDTSQTLTGIIGGGQVGYNMQRGPWVFGLEFDVQGSSQDATWSGIVGGGGGGGGTAVSQQVSLPWFMTLRGRVGYAIGPTWMIYVTGGGAWGEVKSVTTAVGPGVFSWDETRGGWVIGAGVEGRINRQWSWKAEYLHVDLGSRNTLLFGMPTVTTALGVTNDIGRVGVNFHFMP
jgi:outer membrane immunogenic protein